MTTVIVGTGYTGLRALHRLPADEVLGLSRSLPERRDGREVRLLELDNATDAIPLPDAARLIYTVPPATDADHDRRLEALLGALESNPARIVYLSTTGVYGNHAGATVSEDTPLNPQSSRAVRRVAAEKALEAFGHRTGTEITILRVPGIYGPNRLMIERVRDGEAVIEESEANPGNRIHVDDLVTCCLAASARGTPAGVFNVGDGDTRSSTWFASEVARQLGLPPPPTLTRREAEKSWSPMRLSFLGESRVVDTTRMQKTLGVAPRYADAADGIRASLVEMGLST